MGKDLNDIVMLCILAGLAFKGGSQSSQGKIFETSDVNKGILFLVIASFIGMVNSTISQGMPLFGGNHYLVEWKNYMMLPLVWLLTFNCIRDRKTIIILFVLILIGMFGADYYFFQNSRWHMGSYSNRARNEMTSLFVYLGANHYGAFFAHFIFLPIGIMLYTKSFLKKAALLLITLATLYCMVFTYSRGAYLAFLVGMAFIGFVKSKKLLFALIVFLIFWRALVPSTVAHRIDMTRNEQGELENSAATRIVLWDKAWEMFASNPIIGKGYNTFVLYTTRDTHNMYMKIAAELGLLGLISFLYLFYLAFLLGYRLFKETEDPFYKGLGLGFAACVLSAAVTNVFGDRWSFLSMDSYYWMGMALTGRAIQLTVEERQRRSQYAVTN
jgi:O-antigen ligase